MFTEQDYRDQLDGKRVCSCGNCDRCDAGGGSWGRTLQLTADEHERYVADGGADYAFRNDVRARAFGLLEEHGGPIWVCGPKGESLLTITEASSYRE